MRGIKLELSEKERNKLRRYKKAGSYSRVHFRFSQLFGRVLPLAEKLFCMTKEEFVAMAARRYDELQALNKLDNFYDYEKQFVGIWKELGRDVLEKNIGSLPSDKRKKKEADHHLGPHHHQ